MKLSLSDKSMLLVLIFLALSASPRAQASRRTQNVLKDHGQCGNFLGDFVGLQRGALLVDLVDYGSEAFFKSHEHDVLKVRKVRQIGSSEHPSGEFIYPVPLIIPTLEGDFVRRDLFSDQKDVSIGRLEKIVETSDRIRVYLRKTSGVQKIEIAPGEFLLME